MRSGELRPLVPSVLLDADFDGRTEQSAGLNRRSRTSPRSLRFFRSSIATRNSLAVSRLKEDQSVGYSRRVLFVVRGISTIVFLRRSPPEFRRGQVLSQQTALSSVARMNDRDRDLRAIGALSSCEWHLRCRCCPSGLPSISTIFVTSSIRGPIGGRAATDPDSAARGRRRWQPSTGCRCRRTRYQRNGD